MFGETLETVLGIVLGTAFGAIRTAALSGGCGRSQRLLSVALANFTGWSDLGRTIDAASSAIAKTPGGGTQPAAPDPTVERSDYDGGAGCAGISSLKDQRE